MPPVAPCGRRGASSAAMLKISTRLFLPFFAVWALFAPARAYAIVPLVMAAARISAAVLKTPTGQQLLINAPIGIGLAYGIFSVTRTDGTNTRQDDVYLSDAPRAPSAVEAASGFTAGFPSIVPAANAGAPSAMFQNLFHSPFVTADAACQDYLTVYTVAAYGAGLTAVLSGTTCTVYLASGSALTSGTIYSITACGAGYTASGSSCVLTNAALVPRPTDGLCPIVRNGTSYSVDSLDPDCASQAPTLSVTASGGGLAVIRGFDGGFTSIERLASGEIIIHYSTPDAASNTTKDKAVTLSPGATSIDPPIVAGVSETAQSGTGTAAGGSVATTSDPAMAAAVAANTAAINDLKTELAADGEAALVSGGAIPAAATLVQSYADQAADVTQRAGGFGLPSLPGFLFPQFSAPVCAPIGWTFQGRSVSFDLCPYIPTIKSIAAWILNLLAAGICFQMLMNFRAMRVRG